MKKLLLCIFIAGFTYSCNPSNDSKKPDTVDTTNKSTTGGKEPCQTILGSYLETDFYELSLSKAKYEQLKTFHGADARKIVLQFYFNAIAGNSPSLIAYSSKAGNKYNKAGSTKSAILTVTTTKGLAIPDEFVLGDQQVTIRDIQDNLLTPAGNPADFDLIFKPKPSGKNIFYQICIRYRDNSGTIIVFCGGLPGVNSQPSPPADANP